LKDWKFLAATAGSLFIRSYERGERVHLAMLSRGYAGTLPDVEHRLVSRSQWLTGLVLPLLALVTLIITTLLAVAQ
jgi:cobalt/nickel transport system permease protein